MHSRRHPSRIGIPRHEVDHRRAFAHQVALHHRRPDEVIRTEQLECAGHLARIQITLGRHHVLKEPHLVLVDEQHQLAGLREVGLSREKGYAFEPMITVARHRGRRDRQQGSPQAVTAACTFCSGTIAESASSAAMIPSCR